MYMMKYVHIHPPFLPTSNFLQLPQHGLLPYFMSSFLFEF